MKRYLLLLSMASGHTVRLIAVGMAEMSAIVGLLELNPSIVAINIAERR